MPETSHSRCHKPIPFALQLQVQSEGAVHLRHDLRRYPTQNRSDAGGPLNETVARRSGRILFGDYAEHPPRFIHHGQSVHVVVLDQANELTKSDLLIKEELAEGHVRTPLQRRGRSVHRSGPPKKHGG